MTVRTVALTAGQVAAFAAASRDGNPLHTNNIFARRSPYGAPIAHGALVLISALGAVPPGLLTWVAGLSADFLRPVPVGSSYRIEPSADKDEVRVVADGQLLLTLALTFGPDETVAHRISTAKVADGGAAEPEVWTLAELVVAAPRTGGYEPDLPELRAVAADLGAAAVPDALLIWLAWSSWVVGTQLPGRDGLFAGLRLEVGGSAEGQRDSRLAVSRTDARTGAVRVRGSCSGPEGTATAELLTFVRQPIPPVTVSSVREHLARSEDLAGRRVLVIGGSRGFGAALAGALADQGATVWIAYARSAAAAHAVRREFGADRIIPVCCDAADPEQVGAIIDQICAAGMGLDGLVLAAAPPLADLPAHPDAVTPALDYLRSSLELALRPLTAALPALRANDGWLMVSSSAAVLDPPAGWTHYAAAKLALESFATTRARQHRVRTLIVRAPKMWTDMVNGPTGRLGAIPAERVAAAVVRRVIEAADIDQGVPAMLEPADV